ncbi:MAG: glycine cleavage system protein H [Ignavibacteria bacterium]|nr:glycine cleavage system protein H [Ignavibacteria bacterium]
MRSPTGVGCQIFINAAPGRNVFEINELSVAFLVIVKAIWHGNLMLHHGDSAAHKEDRLMSFVLVLLTVAIFVVVELLWRSRRNEVRVPRDLHIDVPRRALAIDRFFHPGHSWVLAGEHDAVTVGVDDFAQRFIGTVDRVDLPIPGQSINQGQVLATLHRGKRSLAHVSPISGVVVAVNDKLAGDPSIVNKSPYDRGWTVKVRPTSLQMETRNLLKGIVAERWMEAVRMELIHWFSPRPGTVLQDGGWIVESVSDLVSDHEWSRLVNDFFPISESPNDKMNNR